MSYNYDTAKKVLSETDKDRFLCCYLNMTDTNAVDWEKAAKDFGSASVQSFKKMIQNAFKKIKDADASGDVEGAEAKVKTTKAATPKKRKGKGAEDGEGDVAEESPKKKGKGGGRKKKAATPVADDDDAEAASGAVKQEDGDELM
ncbi:hypothetical protein LTR85_000621 [Meristemomyces frigidus]|nr:hypothetical protein LTR85_000621 [Meristemomyces frigidus]